MTAANEQALAEVLKKVPMCELVPWAPTPRQLAFLTYMGPESLFGGAARGGKSTAALMSALQFACVPHYNSIIFRRERATLVLPGGLIDLSKRWLTGRAKWNGEEFSWTFPSGATLTFGYLRDPDDIYRYHSTEYQFILFEELTEWPDDTQYRYMFSRLTPKEDVDGNLGRCRCHGLAVSDVPLRMRATSNPGGPGTEWVRARFIIPHRQGAKGLFFPSTVKDNPHINYEQYINQLSYLRPVDRARLLEGDWDITEPGEKFSRDWFKRVEMSVVPFSTLRLVRWWDMAGARSRTRDSDWTAGVLIGVRTVNGEREVWIIDVQRFRATPGATRAKMLETSKRDDELVGTHVPIRVEREPGSQSIAYLEQLRQEVFAGRNFKGVPSRLAKAERIDLLATEAEMGRVMIVSAPWNEAFLDEAEAYDGSGRTHDDQIDAAATGLHALVTGKVGARGGVAERPAPIDIGYPIWAIKKALSRRRVW